MGKRDKFYKEGEMFGNIKYIKDSNKVGRERHAIFQCFCGKIFDSSVGHIKSTHTKSCGCLKLKKGFANLPEYTAWEGMKQRCNNPKAGHYEIYGGRGISVFEEWNTFENFYNYMGKRPSKFHSLDRINTNGNYEPGNVKWSTKKEQSKNRNVTIFLSLFGIRKTLGEWSEITGIKFNTLRSRMDAKWPKSLLLSTPITDGRKIRHIIRKILKEEKLNQASFIRSEPVNLL
jgi:hypothetical protein